MRDAERHRGILLDDEDRRALLVDRADDVEHLVDEHRRQAHRRLVHQQQLRPRHQRAADRDHLLLAARQRAGILVEPLLDAREQCEDALIVGIELGRQVRWRRLKAPSARFSRTVMRPNSRRASGTSEMPRPTIDCVGSRSMRSPPNCTLPERARTMPRIVFIVVDLPEALPPSRQTISPASMLMLTSFSARIGP